MSSNWMIDFKKENKWKKKISLAYSDFKFQTQRSNLVVPIVSAIKKYFFSILIL